MSRKSLIIGAAVLILVGIAVGLIWHRSVTANAGESGVEALGLHGTTKLSRPLSKTQADRLKTHFLDIPGPNTMAPGGPSSRSVTGPAGITDTINQVQAINQLNERQTK